MIKKEKIIVTGSAGFIGMHLCKSFLADGYTVLGIDNLNNSYDPQLKKARLEQLLSNDNFEFHKIDISNYNKLDQIFKSFQPEKVVNLAAQAGVRYSLKNPYVYIESNIVGFLNILECCKKNKIKDLIYASSSSVYGKNKKIPFSVKDRVDQPISIYAVTKKANELMAHTYSHLYDINTTGLRFFTVYGPWGRPDMAMYIFTKKILEGRRIDVFNNGNMERDFTYIDDVIKGLRLAIDKNSGCEVYNIGNSKTEKLMNIIKLIEDSLGKKSIMNLTEMQPGDVKKTFSDIKHSEKKIGYKPMVTVQEGIPSFIKWYRNYYKI